MLGAPGVRRKRRPHARYSPLAQAQEGKKIRSHHLPESEKPKLPNSILFVEFGSSVGLLSPVPTA